MVSCVYLNPRGRNLSRYAECMVRSIFYRRHHKWAGAEAGRERHDIFTRTNVARVKPCGVLWIAIGIHVAGDEPEFVISTDCIQRWEHVTAEQYASGHREHFVASVNTNADFSIGSDR